MNLSCPAAVAGRAVLFLGLTLLGTAVACAAEQPAAKSAEKPADDALGLSPAVTKKLQVFFEKFSREAPDRKIILEPEWRQGPVGFTVIRRRLTSSDEKFNENMPVLVSSDFNDVFIGQAIRLDDAGDVLGPEGPKIVSKIIGEKASDPVEVTWGARKGAGGTFVGKMVQTTPIGKLQMDCWISSDGHWFLIGQTYSLDSDPRMERMKRLKLDGLPSTGPANASVTLLEFSDYECPSCGLRQKDIDAALEKYKGKVRLVHFDHPIWRMHEWATTAADGSRCVEKVSTDAYWKYKKAVYERQKDFKKENFEELVQPIIESLGISFEEWNKCRKEARQRALILKDIDQSFGVGIQGTPTILVNGRLVDYGLDKVLDSTIAKALAGK